MQGVDVNGVNISGALVLLALAVIATNVCLEHSQMAPGILSAKGGALDGTVAAPAPSQPLAMAVDPVVSSFGLELPSSLA